MDVNCAAAMFMQSASFRFLIVLKILGMVMILNISIFLLCSGFESVCRLLVDNGADVKALDRTKRSAAFLAALRGTFLFSCMIFSVALFICIFSLFLLCVWQVLSLIFLSHFNKLITCMRRRSSWDRSVAPWRSGYSHSKYGLNCFQMLFYSLWADV